MGQTRDIAIAGGGIGGLAAALALGLSGHRVNVLAKNGHIFVPVYGKGLFVVLPGR